MLREVLEDAIQRGEQLKKDIVGQILKSAALNDLVGNKRFAETVAKVIQTREVITQALRRNVHDVLKVMAIPSREQLESYERRVRSLEHQIDQLGRRLMKNSKRPHSSSRKKSKG